MVFNPVNFPDSNPNDNIDGLKEYCRNMFWSPTLRNTSNFASLPFNYRQKVAAIDQAEASGQTTPYNYNIATSLSTIIPTNQ